MNINEFKSEIELRRNYKCETFIITNEQVLIVHGGTDKVVIPFNYCTGELDFSRINKISEMEYMDMQNKNNTEIRKNNFYFSK